MPDTTPIRRALISVYDKTGIVDFARALHDEFGVEIISTGGTARTLTEAGIPVTLVEDITGFPEMLDGRVKTLHPKIHAAILADRDNPEHMRQLAEQGIEPIDMVVVNLYPFEQTVAQPDCTFEQAIEMIDIGGPCLLRAAAKNCNHVLTLCRHVDYPVVVNYLRSTGGIPKEFYLWGQYSAFDETHYYDAIITEWTRRKGGDLALPLRFLKLEEYDEDLRYGENPHQQATVYRFHGGSQDCLNIQRTDLCGEFLSFNNYADASAALELCTELTRAPSVAPRGLKPAAPESAPRPHIKEPRASARAVTREKMTPDIKAAFHEPDPQSPAWLLTWTTYGSWLPGDERGFVSRRRAEGGGHVVHNIPGTLYDADHKDVEESARERLRGAPVTLDPVQARTTLTALAEAASNHNINIIAASIMPDHVHLLCQGAQSGPELMQVFKGVSSRRLNQKHELTAAPRWWTKSGSKRQLRAGEDLQPAAEYVCRQAHALWAGSFVDVEDESVCRPGEAARAEARGSLIDREFSAVCFIKHTNACGVAVDADPLEAYRKAYLGDPNAAMGGILAVNFEVDAGFAEAVMETYQRWGKDAGVGGFFVEVWVAPSFAADAVKVIRTKKKWGPRVRLLAVGDMSAEPDPAEMDLKRIAGGVLMQSRDLIGLNEEQWKVVTRRQPTESEMNDLRLAWLICKHTKSNAITICADGMLLGNGAGQMSRVMSCRIATWLARDNGHEARLKGSAAASDAFFPFRDGPDLLADAGVTALIQPGGSKGDQKVIAAADERNLAMIFTGTRHFRH